jgi:HlyD family secretion protein
MRSKVIFVAAAVGLALALISAWIAGQQPQAQKPMFSPAANPFANGVYAEGIIESAQKQGENINIFPEVTGPLTEVLVAEGERVRRGQPLLRIDDSVQRATTQQLEAQAQAALALLRELKAEPRPENLQIAAAQLDNARATHRNAADQLAKVEQAVAIDARAVSRDALDTARNAEHIAATALEVTQRQFELTRAGAWVYDVENQERQYESLVKAHAAAAALLAKYTLTAPADGVVRQVEASVGSYVSTQGAYDTYTQSMMPLVVMGAPDAELHVRAYIDEILIDRLADPSKLAGEMYIRGTQKHVALTFVRVQPFVSPKIELSDQRQELVDVRVLPVVFSFANPKGLNVYPGELVDVYVSSR